MEKTSPILGKFLTLPFLGKVIVKVVAVQFQQLLDDLSQSSFWPGYDMETAPVALERPR